MESKDKKHIDFKTILLMIWIFIKATIIPKFAYRFRNMYLFMPVLLLIISWVLLPIPIQTYMKNNGLKEYKKQNINNVLALYDLSDENYQIIKDLKVRFDLKIMYADDETIDAKEKIIETEHGKLYVVVDLCELDQTKKTTVHYDYANFFDTYDDPNGNNTLLVLYNSNFMIRKNKISNYFEYQTDTINLNEINQDAFANFLVSAMVSTTINTYGWYSALYALVIPLALTLFSFLILKSSGKMKRFREYFNVAGIVSVLPTLLVFILSWIFPNLSLIRYYAPAYLAYFFIFIGVINLKKDKIQVSE